MSSKIKFPTLLVINSLERHSIINEIRKLIFKLRIKKFGYTSSK